MFSFVRNISVKAFPFAMIAVMGLLIANKGLFIHTHKLGNGSVYTHAHPYNKSNDSQPYKSHHHTKVELLSFDSLNLQFFSQHSVVIPLPLITTCRIIIYNDKSCLKLFSQSRFGRAPPAS